jgi:hypothetical protein
VILLGACALIVGYQYVTERPREWRAGVLVAADPQQVDLEDEKPLELKGFEVIPRARFTGEVRVLSRSRYWLGEFANAAPLDIAVGWGPMSDSAVLKDIDISQSGRFYFWHYDDEPPIERQAIETHSANWHLIPATASTWRALRNIRVGDVVTLEGMLVDLASPDSGTLKTSLRRDDTGAGACEIVLVQRVSFRYR